MQIFSSLTDGHIREQTRRLALTGRRCRFDERRRLVRAGARQRGGDQHAHVAERVHAIPGIAGARTISGQIFTQLFALAFSHQGNGTLMRFSYKFVPDLLALPEYRRWSHFMNVGTKEWGDFTFLCKSFFVFVYRDCLNERPECVHKFFLTTSFRGAVSWPEKLETVTHWRRLAARYAHFNLSVYENDRHGTNNNLKL
jgi:hypothetical protein